VVRRQTMKRIHFAIVAAVTALGCLGMASGTSDAEQAVEQPKRLIISPIVSSDYAASIGELVQIDMRGKMAPDVLTIALPEATATNVGQSVIVVTVNSGGAEDGSRVRMSASSNIHPPSATYYDSVGEVIQTLTSTGTYWVLTSGH
jgi:hypothetical protein